MTETILGIWDNQVICTPRPEDEASGITKLAELREYAPGNPVYAVMGWDGYFIYDQAHVDVVDMARAYMEVVQGESCGKCVPCRMGTRVAADLLTRIAEGRGAQEDLDSLRKVADVVSQGSLCELGHSALCAVIDLLNQHPDEFQRTVTEGIRHPRGTYHTKVTAPCVEACPERLDIPRYIEMIKAGHYPESLEVIEEKNPLAAVCGRVCVRFCEFACRRGKLDDPISIKHLKRFVSDVRLDAAVKIMPDKVHVVPDAPLVAVIGAGPAGVTAAYHLLRKGYPVEIFEASGAAGGMAVWGIPDYRLPRDVVRSEVEIITSMGAIIHYNQRLGRDFSIADLKARGFKAVFVAIGAQLGTGLRIPGEEPAPEGYLPGIEFLHKVNAGEAVKAGDSAVIVGGGNVAMDCCRSALRLGIRQVHLVYRRGREEMPADKLEVHDAEEEGIIFHMQCNPTRLITENGKLTGVECVRMILGEPDATGRRRPVPQEGSEFIIPCDMLFPAIGQRIDTSCLADDGASLDVTKHGTVAADDDTLLTSEEGVFAGGDCVSGPATLIQAMAAGLRASNSIDQYLKQGYVSLSDDERMSRVYRAVMAVDEDSVQRLGGAARKEVTLRPVKERVDDFDEVEQGLSPEDALLEADRCLRCYRILLVATDK
ncbi:MAG: FAD-dependent oxidoreductase [Chloroflexi bacterium]|nr:FAD-dependent oxidoreductase [Chloroflexota bacterium]